jgi:transcriptional regulator with XRE-family HTH domain
MGRRGVSQSQLAEAVGVHRVTVSEWERNPQVDLGSKQLVAISAFLGIEPNWLLTGQGPMRPTPTTGKSYGAVIDERLGAIRGALGLVLPAGHEGRDFDAFASQASIIGSLAGALFFLDEAAQSTHRACFEVLVEAILDAKRFAHTDQDFSNYLVARFKEIAQLFDKTAELWQSWEDGELELDYDNENSVFMDDILKLTAPPEFQVVPRFVPTDAGDSAIEF